MTKNNENQIHNCGNTCECYSEGFKHGMLNESKVLSNKAKSLKLALHNKEFEKATDILDELIAEVTYV